MPFLRRRTNMGSESDMRRHSTLFDNGALSVPKPPPSRAGSTSDLASPPEGGPVAPPPSPLTSADPAVRPSTPSINERPSIAFSHASTETGDRPLTPPIQEATPKTRRFSMLRFRNASDSQLAAKAKMQAAAQKPPPLPRPPEIITTAPTVEFNPPQKKPSRLNLAARMRKSNEILRVESSEDRPARAMLSRLDRRKSMVASTGSSKLGVTFEEPPRPPVPTNVPAPPAYGTENGHALALPVNRLSESSRSDGTDGSSGDRVYGSTTTTTHTVSTTTTFFKLSRRKQKQPEPLFPIAHLAKGKSTAGSTAGGDGNASSASTTPAPNSVKRSPSKAEKGGQTTPTPSRPSSGHGVMGSPTQSPARTIFAKANPSPATALFRPNSRSSVNSSPTRAQLHLRGRSSTMSSLGRNSPRASVDEHLAPPNARTSFSTGRRSFGDLLGLRGMRQTDGPATGRQGSLTPATPGSNTSKNNSLHLARDTIVLPERQEDDTPSKYLEKLLGVLSRSVIAAALSKGTDQFSQSVLRSYMRGFMFFEDPMDMAIRKLLMEAELPKETQQIDRTLQAFANRYHECNPGIFISPDQAYFIAFSLLILHTDVFNKNNKHKMTRNDYLKNTRGEGIFDEILEVFYDNITYTPFIHVEDDLDINGERIIAHKTKKRSILPSGQDPAKRVAKEPIDPYTLIIDRKLDILRPNLKDVMHLEDHYSYLGTARGLNLRELQKTFFRTGVLQIVSARSRPDAFMSEKTATNPQEAHPGIVDIKITKVGLLWRKDPKKKRARSPWQEWGAILTGAQLYFFRNTPWVKNLMHQYEEHIRKGHDGDPCYFKPPLEQFKPDALMSTDGAVALLDSMYKKHKHAFAYVRHGGFEEVLLAENEAEMNDWLAKLNYAAAFRTSGVRMRGVVGGSYDGQGRRAIRRLDGDNAQSIASPTGDVTVTRSRVDHKMAQDILAARRDIMLQKVADANEKVEQAEKDLDSQLRNARHLQILAPIQPKTREQMLVSAAKMMAKLKWTRIEIWRLKCHRDILLMDLEEERQQLGLPKPLDIPHPAVAIPERSTSKDEALPSDASPRPKSPKSPVRLGLTRSSTVTVKSDEHSPSTEIFQTPPTSATAPSFHKKQNSWELPNLNFEPVSLRKTSVSSAVSSIRSITATPPRITSSAHSSPEKAKIKDEVQDETEDVDAEERDLLEQAGLIKEGSHGDASRTVSGGAESAEHSDRHRHQSHRRTSGSVRDKADSADRKKVRRSLQRTLRESAGHLSHHRSSRRGKDSVSSGAPSEEITWGSEAPDQLSRGSGSFVVHGKKASVITFGQGFQMMAPEERMRQRKASTAGLFQNSEAPQSPTPSSPTVPTAALLINAGAAAASVGASGFGATGEETSPAPDFRAVLTEASQTSNDRERRESAASASTATARSFRELRRKYSQASRPHGMNSSGNLVVPSDEDSDAAISFSEGRHTPLPPTGEEDEHDNEQAVVEEDEDEDTEDESETGDEGETDEDGESEFSPPPSRREEIRREDFFTPEPPMSPPADTSQDSVNFEETVKGKEPQRVEPEGGERLPSPPLQSVTA